MGASKSMQKALDFIAGQVGARAESSEFDDEESNFQVSAWSCVGTRAHAWLATTPTWTALPGWHVLLRPTLVRNHSLRRTARATKQDILTATKKRTRALAKRS